MYCKPLLLGIRPEELGFDETKCFCSGVSGEDIKWVSINLKTAIPDNVIELIYIGDVSLLETDEGFFQQRAFHSILRILRKDGTLYIVNFIRIPKLDTLLREAGLVFQGFKEINKRLFNIYNRSQIKPVLKQQKITQRVYNLLDIDIDSKSEKISISLEEFTKEITRCEFIKMMTESIDSLLAYKIDFYLQQRADVKKKFLLVQKKVKNISEWGVDRSVAHDLYPMYEFYAGFLFDLQELYKTLSFIRKNLNPLVVQSNLHEAIYNTKRGLASLVGREDIKNKIVSQLYAFSRNWKIFAGHFCNFALLGSSGVGKTAVGKVISFIFSKSGILATENVHIVTRSDLVGQYVGQTAPRTRSLLLASLEGVLFIDEAYQLAVSHKVDFGHEAITEMVNFMDKYVGMSIVIVAGYEQPMERFFNSNEGLQRRFPHHLILEPYSISELTDILIAFLERSLKDKLSEIACNSLFTFIYKINQRSNQAFDKQAGDMLNLGAIILTTVFSSYRYNWNQEGKNVKLLKSSFSRFLENKGLKIV